ncbi:MAG: hypothetical protein HUK24_07110 [Sphaerochaetaceae bacterium]|nr:hypothetical protein [Sphaerochaetaceae bacterium]
MEFLVQLNSTGVTVVMVTHDMHLMLEYTQRALVFNKGALIADTTPWSVLCNSTLVEEASLKETSLFTLSKKCSIEETQEFTRCFIEVDRENREHDI